MTAKRPSSANVVPTQQEVEALVSDLRTVLDTLDLPTGDLEVTEAAQKAGKDFSTHDFLLRRSNGAQKIATFVQYPDDDYSAMDIAQFCAVSYETMPILLAYFGTLSTQMRTIRFLVDHLYEIHASHSSLDTWKPLFSLIGLNKTVSDEPAGPDLETLKTEI